MNPNANVTTFLGKPTDHWVGINDVLEAHNIRDAKALNEKLGAAERIEVRDSKNPERLLGTLPRMNINWGRYVRIPIMPTASVSCNPGDYTDAIISAMRTVDLDTDYTGDTFTRRLFFKTSAPLDTLLLIRDFRLPGESKQAASERRYRAGF